MRNVEFKAELRDATLARSIARRLGGRLVDTLVQTDTYFRVPHGRLKRRETPGQEPQWIEYRRADEAGAQVSRYRVWTEAQARERFGSFPLPVRVVVRKRREVYLVGETRVHLDQVEGLGMFVEFESPVRPGRSVGTGQRDVARLRSAFAPALGEAIAASYADLLAGEGGP